ncbi:tetratricopeptide repeat protein [Psychromonas sp. KJ10-10]|uniref:tetratricopeptide repeat protein n=1 Tax=Psychromonas sp. KJ10-10 TaxID=3391823 RepID=UPI0039B3987A
MINRTTCTKKWSAGITTTRQLRSLAPDNVIWWQQLANLYLYINDNKSALITLQQADRAGLKLSLQQRQLLANLYADAQVPFSATTLYDQLDAENESEQLLQQQAIYWQATKEWDKAISSWQKVAKLNNQHYWSLARLHLQLHHYQDALQALELLKEKSKQMLLLQVQILDELGNTDLALTTAQKAHEKHPSESTLNWIKYLSNKQTTL